jgi:hypothetical protein
MNKQNGPAEDRRIDVAAPPLTKYYFIPKHLEIEGRPDLDPFPFNILFARFREGVRDGAWASLAYTALYEPDIDTYDEQDTSEGRTALLTYRNAYGGDDHIVIEHSPGYFTYRGCKYVNGEEVGSALGKEWKMFFVHLEELGLVEGEICKVERV